MRLDADMRSILYVQCCFFIVLLLTPCLSPHLLTFGHCAPLPYGFLRLSVWAGSLGDAVLSLT